MVHPDLDLGEKVFDFTPIPKDIAECVIKDVGTQEIRNTTKYYGFVGDIRKSCIYAFNEDDEVEYYVELEKDSDLELPRTLDVSEERASEIRNNIEYNMKWGNFKKWAFMWICLGSIIMCVVIMNLLLTI